MVVTLGQQYSVGVKPTVILYTCYINRHAETPNKTRTKYMMSLAYYFKKNLNASKPSEYIFPVRYIHIHTYIFVISIIDPPSGGSMRVA